MSKNEKKLRETNQLLHFYDTAIERQKASLADVHKGKLKSTQVTDEVLYALVRGDLTRLQSTKSQLEEELRKLQESINHSGTNGNHSTSSTPTGDPVKDEGQIKPDREADLEL